MMVLVKIVWSKNQFYVSSSIVLGINNHEFTELVVKIQYLKQIRQDRMGEV